MAGTLTKTELKHRSRGVVRTDITVVTDASGAATAVVTGVGFGRLVAVLYDGGLDASATVTISDAKSGTALITYTTGTEGTPVYFRPTTVITTDAGAEVTAAAEAPNVNRDIYIAGRITIGVASGGNAETGKFALIIDEAGIGPVPYS